MTLSLLPVCPSKTSPCVRSKRLLCMPAPRAHVETQVRVVAGIHGDVLNAHTEGVLYIHTRFFSRFFSVPQHTHTKHTPRPQRHTPHNTTQHHNPQHHTETEADTDRERQKQTETERDRERETETDRNREKQRETDRERDRKRDKTRDWRLETRD